MSAPASRPRRRTPFEQEFRALAWEKSQSVRLAFKDEPILGDLALLLLFDERLTVQDRARVRDQVQQAVDDMRRRKGAPR